MTTTLHDFQPTVTLKGPRTVRPPADLMARYHELLGQRRLAWTAHPPLGRLLGQGGQGVVYLSERRGADGFTVPIALKIFSPERYEDTRSYEAAMSRIARVASHVAQIQHDNLLDVQDFYDRSRVRVMAMEWVDGCDLRSLLSNDLLERIRDRVSVSRWEYINRVIVTPGKVQPQIKPGVAVAIVRECLAALAALHREGIIHSDVKPGNIMIKRTGHSKIIDIGSAFELADLPAMRTCTPSYAAPEVLEGRVPDPRSDLASLGYVLLELLAGRPVFSQSASFEELLEAKQQIHRRLESLLPAEVTCNSLLMNFCRKLVAPDPTARFTNAETAELVKGGAAAFHRQLVKGDLASEYDHEIRLWLEEVKELEELECEAETRFQDPRGDISPGLDIS
jgi:serine/threonine-protein kinase